MIHRFARALLAATVIHALMATVATRARADERDVTRSDTRDGYAYRFDDDAVVGTGRDAQGSRIRAIRHAERDVLIRPRFSFVPELLKSVESL